MPHSPQVAKWVTVSIGGVTVVPQIGDDYSTFLKIADAMLYDAKRFGRNRVVWANEKMKQWQEKALSATEKKSDQQKEGTV